jgi:hypothetical protein
MAKIILSEQLASKLADDICKLQFQYHHNPNGSDYQCAFCFAYDGDCEQDCDSREYLKALEPTEED